MRSIQQEYVLAKSDPNFDLREFVSRHFYEFAPHKQKEQFTTDPRVLGSLRVSFGWASTDADCDAAIAAVNKLAQRAEAA